jgi:uncharacterized protein (TIGR04255 family)
MAVSDGPRVLAIRNELSTYPRMAEMAQQEIGMMIGPAGPSSVSSGSKQQGWRLQSEDGLWTVALLPDFFALECTGYTSWTEFRQRMTDLAQAILTHLQPTIELRLGLRYVDQLTVPAVDEPRAWSGYINEHLLGPVLDEQLGSAVVSLQQLAQFQGPDGLQVLLRHGTQLDSASGTWPYVMDTDCFRSDGRRMEVDSLMTGADALHKLALQVFQAAITPRLHKLLAAQEDL